jgi:UDP-N-acetylmuramyl pentapeptide phosphotransferase/UDP-N-acetylglucosamine-1-phosphate transferase
MFLTVLVSFLSALALSLLTTPIVIDVARRRGLVDLPSDRKVHQEPIPRVGGISIFLSVTAACAASVLYHTWSGESILPPSQIGGLLGAAGLSRLGCRRHSGLLPRLAVVQIAAG